ncbi:hypothetical protein [Kitasatospora sp. NPDC088134]|uniref:WXG100-like domain-containing protein n=1 Tax=Kitasatospora sp. NPDC088134 TaxID=3364071 RepID=UPI0038286B49
MNEDKIREFASHVREFGQNVESAHEQSTSTVQQLGQAYEALLAKWASVSDQHLNELVQACHVVADALDIAADVTVAMKVETIGELIALAAAFVADQAAVLLIEETAKRLINYLEQQLEQYIIAQVVETAIGPLIDTVARAVQGLVFQAAESALGVSANGGGGGGTGFRIDPDALDEHARMVHEHAETVAGHAEVFQSKIASVSFE